MTPRDQGPSQLRLHGARQHNLRGIDIDLLHGRLTVVSGVSGAGKSSLVFDTLYAEGQRRYVETFSPYARQFLDRLERPAVDRIEGLLPAVAVDSFNPVRNSRSTVGTATELVDHLRLLFARTARPFCPCCGQPIEAVTPVRIAERLRAHFQPGERAAVCFAVVRPEGLDDATLEGWLAREGYTRIQAEEEGRLWVVQDRLRPARRDDEGRLVEALELALGRGRGEIAVWPLERAGEAPLRFRTTPGCADCDFTLPPASAALFSFNSPAGACAACRGFGRVMGVDMDLVIPDARRSLSRGAVKPWQTKSFRDCLKDLERHAGKSGLALDLDAPWSALNEATRRWVIEGDGKRNGWYGIEGFFRWLEGQSYKMHIRVLLSKYRAYTECPECHGSRLRREPLWWRLGTQEAAARALEGRPPAPVRGPGEGSVPVADLPGLALHDVLALPIARLAPFLRELELPARLSEAVVGLLAGLRSRVDYLDAVGLGYLTLDRQARTLSGGEIQRIHLTTALGTGLVNTLFLLDEPSIGLHPQDVHRVVEVMQRLRDAGNTLVVVDHDPAILAAADQIIDLGPGPGSAGGQVVYSGPVAGLAGSPDSLTGDYLAGRRTVAARHGSARALMDGHPCLHLEGVRAHTLRNVSVSLPLGRLVVVAGVSGSGKSTLIEDVLHPALQRALGQACLAPGEHDALRIDRPVDEVVLVDQSPIGRTTRSNPASYVGAFDRLRARFAATPLARERGWTAGRFSFNAGTGRCPACSGSGHEHVEMQFLADVYLRCPACDGRRFRPETLEVRVETVDGRRLDIAQALDLTVADAMVAFGDDRAFVAAVEPLVAVGLDYLRLGQPVPTLSAGEAQRLKLAGVLAGTADGGKRGGQVVYLLDEPTSGLHFHDTARLLASLQRLVDAGQSVIVIEHDLEVIRAADWVVELGPGAGSAGGRVVFSGPPAALAGHPGSPTGAALAHVAAPLAATPLRVAEAPPPSPAAACIEVRNAHEHNLKGLSVQVPRDAFTVVTGVSGSGKSTLAFDILFAEGQRRYLESINAWARRVVQPPPRPEVDAVLGLPPTVAIEQRTSRGGHRSTVATATEVHHFLRLLWTRLGEASCAACGGEVATRDREGLIADLLARHRGVEVEVLAALVVKRKGIYSDLAAWAAGHGQEWLRVDGVRVRTDAWPKLARHRVHDIELPVAKVKVGPRARARLQEALETAWAQGSGLALILTGEDPQAPSERVSLARACRDCGATQPEPDPRLFSFSSAMGWCPDCRGSGRAGPALPEEDIAGAVEAEADAGDGALETPCPACDGSRLSPAARAVRVQGIGIDALARLDVAQTTTLLRGWSFHGRAQAIAGPIVSEVLGRLDCLERLGLGYLTLERGMPTLSGGEAQRIRLAAQLGSNLRGVCYVLDEPTIGLHPRDNDVLIGCIEGLRDAGNTVVVVEHDESTIRRADHLIDLGPGAGRQGGELVASGTVADLTDCGASLTGRCLAASGTPVAPASRTLPPRDAANGWLSVRGATLHNLDGIDVSLPLAAVTVVTGVSGSGKSSLVRGVLGPSLAAALARTASGTRRRQALIGCSGLEGHRSIERVVEVDQTPIGRTPRSCPATYLGVFDDIRRIYAQLPEARLRGYGPQRFSFNLKEGRCPECEGQGVRTLEMSFLPAAALLCEACSGGRYAPATCEVRLRGLSIADLLALPVTEAREHLAPYPRVAAPLTLLEDVGLGYLSLGQPSPTLSGGEAQRLKLVTELASGTDDGATRRKRPPHTLYLLDEPTVGLHMADVTRLMAVLDRLAAAGHTVVVVEHNLELIARADWAVDLGPEGGARGGRVVFAGPPRELAKQRGSHTARYLKPLFRGTRRL